MENQDYEVKTIQSSEIDTGDENLDNYLNNFFINNVVGTYEILYCSDFIKCSETTICQ